MAERGRDNPRVAKIQETVGQILDYDLDGLTRRPDWGTINFDDARYDLDRISGIASHLRLLPIEQLTADALNQIANTLNSTLETLKKVDAYSIEIDSPSQHRDQLADEVHTRAEALYTAATPWIPYLAYVRGDVEQNIRALTESVSNARDLVTTAREDIEKQHEEIGNIVTAAREASAAGGAAVFTQDFENESTTLSKRSGPWLRASGFLTLGALLVAVAILLLPVEGDTAAVISQTTARLAILGIFVAAGLWCGRVYKALLHQSAVNRHRALSLQTFQAFSKAASDDPTRDAVLLEATRAVFGPGATGFLDPGAESGGGLQVVEVARRILGAEEAT